MRSLFSYISVIMMLHFYTEQQNEPKRLGYLNKVISSYVIITMNANLPE